LKNYIKHITHPELMHDVKNKKNYFEGWYFKNVSHCLKHTISFIVASCINEDDSHCFIQVIENINNQTYYFKFAKDDFEYNDNPFYIKIKNNFFSFDKIIIDLDGEVKIKGHLEFGDFTKIKNSLFYPNIMGPFLYPKMECYHDIISLNHHLSGSIIIDKKTVCFDNGKGYIEKDFGSSFPNKYIWLQSNHSINKNSDNIFLSLANIPFFKSSFTGLISILTIDNKQYRFATYNLAKSKKIAKDKESYFIEVKKGTFLLSIKVTQGETKQLVSPNKGKMNGTIYESLDGILEVKLYKKSQLIYENKFLASASEFYNY